MTSLEPLIGQTTLAVYLLLFALLAGESLAVPVPSSLSLVFVGALDSQSKSPISLCILIITATLGSTFGGSVAYFVGLRGGRPAILFLGRFLRVDEDRLLVLEERIIRARVSMILFSRVTPYVRSFAAYVGGILRVPFPTFAATWSAASLAWCSILICAGYFMGAKYPVVNEIVQAYSLPFILLVLVCAICLYTLKRGMKWTVNRRRRRAAHHHVQEED